jgi:hypothetical protein
VEENEGLKPLNGPAHLYTYLPCHLHVHSYETARVASLRWNLKTSQGVRAVATIGGDGSATTLEKEGDSEAETGADADNDDDTQISERVVVN